jgi:hypothetical protein
MSGEVKDGDLHHDLAKNVSDPWVGLTDREEEGVSLEKKEAMNYPVE